MKQADLIQGLTITLGRNKVVMNENHAWEAHAGEYHVSTTVRMVDALETAFGLGTTNRMMALLLAVAPTNKISFHRNSEGLLEIV